MITIELIDSVIFHMERLRSCNNYQGILNLNQGIHSLFGQDKVSAAVRAAYMRGLNIPIELDHYINPKLDQYDDGLTQEQINHIENLVSDIP
jgi:hypothetical protein